MNMRCSNCGQEIPTEGNVCSYCKIVIDKTPNRLRDTWTTVGWILGCMLGVLTGYLTKGSIESIGIGFFVGSILGISAGMAFGHQQASAYQRRNRIAIAATTNGQSIASRTHYSSEHTSADKTALDFAVKARQQEAALLSTGDYKKCPYCAEVIKAEANVCRFCQRDLL